MTQISLRAYIREIDNLIERELLDEAIAHCRHILQTYPKHIDTYRLLGKSYLEAKRYGDAADIFQRVLSAVPDDFVSHIGMTIVREDEGNLDSAIWHMERAFETNPANPAIQQELRRLIGRRDGFEPHKVRLTRGALARMYAQGELYPQAIAELQSALQEDQERPDLQVLLAEMLWQTDQKMEAADVSRQILEKLPFCQKAARIMAAVHQEQGKSDEGTAYHRRLAQLDPYAAYVEYPMVDTIKVEADTIRIERLDWRPGQPLPTSESSQPDWAESLGVEIQDDPDEIGTGGPLPSWLEDIEPTADSLEIDDGEEEPAPQSSPFETPPSLEDEEPGVVEEGAEAEIPDWMSDAGWEESSGEAVEAPVSFSESELSALERGELPAEEEPIQEPSADDSEDLAPAEIPSWLQERAPSTGESQPLEVGQEVDDDAQTGSQGAPDWVGETAEHETPPAEAGADEQDLTPDWLGEMATEAGTEEMSAELPSFDFAEEDEPVDTSEATSGPADQGEIPSWLDDSEPGATPTILTWLGNREDEEDGQDVEAEEESKAVPDWMEAALEEDGEDETIPSMSTDDEPAEAPPAWLSGLAQAAAESDKTEFDELTQLRAETEATAEDDLGTEETEAQPGEIPDWLMAIRGDEGASEKIAEEDFEAELPEAFPWESEEPDHEEPIPETTMDLVEESPAEETVPPTSTERTMPSDLPPADEADAASWLENLSEESEDTWISDVEATEDAGLDSATSWLENLGQPDEEEPAARMGPSAEEPDWMRGLEDEDTDDEAIGDLASTWLEGLADTLAETPAEPDEASVEAGADSDDVPTWLLNSESPQAEVDLPHVEDEESLAQPPEPESPAPPPAEGDTDRLQLLEELGLQESETSEEIVAPTEGAAEEAYDLGQLDEMDDDQIFDWLEGLAARDTDEAAEEEEPAPSRTAAGMAAEDAVEATEAPTEDAEADLGWLEQLAEQRGISSDIQTIPASPSGIARPVEEPQPEAEPDLPAEQPTEIAAYEATPAEPQEAQPPVSDQAVPATEPEVDEPEPEPEEAPSAEVPDWLIAAQEQVAPETQAPPTQAARQDEPQAPPPTDAEPEPEQAPTAEVPDWLIAAQEQAAPETQAARQDEPQAPPPAEAEPEPEQAPAAEVPDWLIAAQEQAAPETQTPPTQAARQDEPSAPPPAEAEPEPEQAPAAEAPDWLIAAQDQAAPETQTPPTQAARQDEPSAPPPAEAEPEPKPAVSPEVSSEAPPEPESIKPTEPKPAEEPEPEEAPQPAAPPAAVPVPADDKPSAVPDEGLERAREALETGDVDQAADEYGQLIKASRSLTHVVEDLEAALDRDPESSKLWQLLGDAYMKADRTSEAVRAYSRGMKEAEVLNSARQALASGDQQRAAAQYGILIKGKTKLDDVIRDLENAVAQADDQPAIWQILGDAYMKADRLDESIEAYRRGMSSV